MLVPADDSDRDYFENLSELVYRDLLERQVGNWDADRERNKFNQKWQEHNFQKVYLSGELIGGFWVQEFESYHQLREIQIHPNYQNQGIGTKILLDLIEQCSRKKVEFRLRVLKLNPSVTLYQRLGFKVLGENEHQYFMVYTS